MMDEEKSVSSVPSGGTGMSGSLTERRSRRPSKTKVNGTQQTKQHRAIPDGEEHTLPGLDVALRSVIPTPPVRATPFHLDTALANLESQLTGITAGSSGLTAAPVASFPPTNFYIQWPPPSHVVTEEQRRLNGGGNYKNNWISPRDLLVEKTLKPKTAADFPAELTIHSQKHQPGLMGFQGDIPLSAVRAMDPTAPLVGGGAAKHFTGRILNEVMSERNKDTFTGAKPKSTGEKNSKVGPGDYSGPLSAPLLSRSAHTFKPKPPKRFDDRGLIQGPAPGSYSVNPAILERKVPALHFGGTQKTHSRSSVMANQTGAIGTDPGGPGYYDLAEPKFGGEPTHVWQKAPRFSDPTGATQTGMGIGQTIEHSPGPCSYQLRLDSMSHGAGCVSFSARGGGGSAAAAAVNFKRASGPAVGSYNPTDGLDIGAASLNGSTVTTARPLHKFSATPRFEYHSRPNVLYALTISSAKQRSSELSRNFKPDLSAFQGQRKEQLMALAKEQRKERHQQAQQQRLLLRAQHLEQLDKIIHSDLYRQQEREREAAAEFLNFVKKGWLFYIALTSRMQVMKENIRRVRTAKNLRLLTTNAARTIVTYAKKWSMKAHAKKVRRCAGIILRALRRNVTRASLRKKRRACRLLTILLLNRLNKQRALLAIVKYRANAIKIQRCIRAYLQRKHGVLELLKRQWIQYELLLSSKYKSQEGEKSFEKIRKKGLLIKNLTLDQQRQKIIKEVPFDLIEDRLRESMIEEDYNLRLKLYRHAKYEWLKEKRKLDGQPELISIIDQAIKERARKEKELAATQQQQLQQALSAPPATPGQRPSSQATPLPTVHQQHQQHHPPAPVGPSPTALAFQRSADAAAAAIASGLPPPGPFDPLKPPVLARLVTPLRLYWLLSTAQQRQAIAQGEALGTNATMDPELRKKYKAIIGKILRSVAAKEAKERKAKEKAIAERERLKQEAVAEAAAALAAANAPPSGIGKPIGASSMSVATDAKKKVVV